MQTAAYAVRSPLVGAVATGGDDFKPMTVLPVCNLGVVFDTDLRMRHYVDVVSRYLAAFRQLCNVCQYDTIPVMLSLVTSFAC